MSNDDEAGTTLDVERASAKAPKVQVELDLAGFFEWQPSITEEQERAIFDDKHWAPATVDFLEVMGSSTHVGMNDFAAILGEIAVFGPKSVKRVNFMTHANREQLGIRGFNDPTNVFFTDSVFAPDIEAFAQVKVRGRDGKFYTMDQIRARFTDDAVFVLYACKVGNNKKLLKALHDLLHIKIIGFKKEIVYCPLPQTRKRFVRKGMKIGVNNPGFICDPNMSADWRGLINGPGTISEPP